MEPITEQELLAIIGQRDVQIYKLVKRLEQLEAAAKAKDAPQG